MDFISQKKFLLLGFFVVLLLAIPLTVYFVQKQQETRSHAAKATQVLFSPASSKTTNSGSGPIQQTVGSAFSLDINIDPGSNVVGFVKLTIKYDSSKLATSSANTSCGSAFCPTEALTVLQGPTYTDGTIFVELISGTDVTKLIQDTTKIGTLTFEAKAITDPSNPAQISFDTTPGSDNTNIGSYNCGQQQGVTGNPCPDQPGENVLSSAPSAYVQVNEATSVSTTPGPGPVCASFTADRSTTGTAPLSIAFTATGTDSDGTISKVSFDFGDGPVQDVTQGGGIGTKSISLQTAHTYASSGTFTARATLTDSNGTTSTDSCTQSITITGGEPTPTISGGGTTTTQLTGTPTATLTPTTSLTSSTTNPPQQIVVTPTIAPTGPGDTFIKAGAAGAIISIIGGLLFLAL